MEFNVSAVLIPINLTLMQHINNVDTSLNSVHNTSINKSIANSAYEWWYIVLCYFIVFVLSIPGNCMVIATLVSNRRMRTVTNVFLLNLAVSDFLQGVFCLPFTLIGQIFRKFLFGAAMCKMVPFFQAVSVTVDVWTLVAISLERYFAICRPLRSRQWQTQCHAYKIIAMVWLLSLMLNLPILLVSQLQPMKKYNDYKCREVWPGPNTEKAFNLGLDAALFLFPLFIMTFAYSLIISKLWRGMKHEIQHNFNWQRQLSRKADCKSCCTAHVVPVSDPFPDIPCKNNENHLIQSYPTDCKKTEDLKLDEELLQSHCIHTPLEIDFHHAVRSTHIDKSIEAKRKVIRMLFVLVINFFLCWTPLHLINMVYLFYPDELYSYMGPKTIAFLQLLAYCPLCCNPITYCFMNKKFRQGFIHLIRSCKIFGCCFSEESESQRQVTLQPSSQDMTNCIVRGSQTGRTDLDAQDGEECV